MEQLIWKLPSSSGQIFAVKYPVPEVLETAQEQVVRDSDLNPRQVQILEALHIFKQASADLLLQYLRMSFNSVRHLQKLLYQLHPAEEKHRYVEYITLPKPQQSRFGSAPYVYTLGRKGHKFLKKRGFDTGRYRAVTDLMQEDVPLRHRLAVNEFLLRALQLAENHPEDVQLLRHLHEQYWNGNPLKVNLPDADKPVGLSPDLLLAFETYNPLDQHWLPVEINRSREWEKDWEKKVLSYLYCLPAYKERVGTDILTTVAVMVVSPTAFPRRLYAKLTVDELNEQQIEATRRERRMQLMKQWTEKYWIT